MELTCSVDTTNLNKAQAILLRHSNNVPARSINKTALFVIRKAQELTPVVSQATIDSDMNVTTSPAVLKSGKLSKDKSRQHEVVVFDNRTPTPDDVSAMNTAMRIVLARLHPTSRYSSETGNRWGSPPGVIPNFGRGRSTHRTFGGSATDARTLFWAWVKQVAERMVKARHSSTGFLKHSWAAIIYKLIPFAGGGGLPDVGDRGEWMNFGEVKPAMEGYAIVYCRCDNTMGIGNQNDVMSEKYNKAAHEILEPVLQQAIDLEFKSKLAYANSKEWAKDEPSLAALGLLVKP